MIKDDQFGARVDEKLASYTCLENPRSFFLLAGAGSGKTRSLVKTLQHIKETNGDELNKRGKRIAVITYTRAASEEIIERLEYDPLFHISTIHSFAWLLIKDFPQNIKNFLKNYYINKLSEDRNIIETSKSTTKKYANAVKSITRYEGKLEALEEIKKFSYNPDSGNKESEGLNHSQVIAMFTCFLAQTKLMPKLLVQQFPIIFIDECQDTDKNLIESFLKVENESKLCIGLFGDMMQRIYQGGKEDLFVSVKEAGWEQPVKNMNWRSRERIVRFINRIREDDDKLQQIPSPKKDGGFVKVYVVQNSPTLDYRKLEKKIEENMSTYIGKEMSNKGFNRLILEHHMAAVRHGFAGFFTPLYGVDKYKDGILDGTLREVKFLDEVILGLFLANKSNNKLEIANIVKKNSNFLKEDTLKENDRKQVEILREVNEKIIRFLTVFETEELPTLKEVINRARACDLFEIPSNLCGTEGEEEENEELVAWNYALESKLDELVRYIDYKGKVAGYVTQQGSKGLEYKNVIAIIDDKSAKGNQHSFEKLFGVKPQSSTDLENENAGRDHSIARTRRLFYVACSRAEESLGIIIYTDNSPKVKEILVDGNFVTDEEIEIVDE